MYWLIYVHYIHRTIACTCVYKLSTKLLLLMITRTKFNMTSLQNYVFALVFIQRERELVDLIIYATGMVAYKSRISDTVSHSINIRW